MRLKIEQGISVVEDDANFHLAISEATHNKIQTHLMFSIYDILKKSLGKYYESIKMQDVYEQHCKVVDAIKKRDSALASRRMHEHLDYVETSVKELAEPDRNPH
jgi:GntR family transcriptional repressor for pyruvate dehydrogenase complex